MIPEVVEMEAYAKMIPCCHPIYFWNYILNVTNYRDSINKNNKGNYYYFWCQLSFPLILSP